MIALVLMLGCRTPTPGGVFVGNPEFTARFVSTETARAGDGRLVAVEVGIVGCAEPSDNLGAFTFLFENGRSTDPFPLPEVEGCGLRIAGTEFNVTFTTDQGAYDITGVDFDFDIPGAFFTSEQPVLILGGQTWLDRLEATVGPGTYTANSERPALREAFFDGLLEESTIEVVPAP